MEKFRLSISDDIKYILEELIDVSENKSTVLENLQDQIVEKVEEANSLIAEYNDEASCYNQKVEETYDELDAHITDLRHELSKMEETYDGDPPSEFEELEDWVADWDEFAQSLSGLGEVSLIDEVDEPWFSDFDAETSEVYQHLFGNQPKHSISLG